MNVLLRLRHLLNLNAMSNVIEVTIIVILILIKYSKPYDDKDCYFEDITSGKYDDSLFSVGNDFTNKISETLIKGIKKMK